MVIDSTMPKSTFIRLSLLLFFQNKFLYIYLIVCGVVTAYALSIRNYGLLFVAWLPYVAYLALGIITTIRKSSGEDQPFLLPTRYIFQKRKLSLKHPRGKGSSHGMNSSSGALWPTAIFYSIKTISSWPSPNLPFLKKKPKPLRLC